MKDFRAVAKEKHILLVEAIKRVQEVVNLKLEEICFEMAKEVVKLDNDYSTLNMKVDIVVAAITKLVELYKSLLTKIDTNSDDDSKSFAILE